MEDQMSEIENRLIERLEELNVPVFVIEDALAVLTTEEEQKELMVFVKENKNYDEVARKIAQIAISSGYGEELDDNEELE